MRSTKIPTVYIGTTVEGLSTAEALLNHHRIDLRAVITQPDRPFGREKVLKPTVIKEFAVSHNLPVVTPESDEESYKTVLSTYHPEFAVCIAFGQFLPGFFLSALPHFCLNVHYSLLPVLRGAVPVQAAILQGLEQTGVTVQVMEEKMDTGPVVIQRSVPISATETTPSLKEKLIPLGKELVMEVLEGWLDGNIKPQQQDESKATYCYMQDISREKARIAWEHMEPDYIERMIRALLPWPVAWTTLPDGKSLKIFSAELIKNRSSEQPGTILPRTDGMYFATKDSEYLLKAITVQPEGKQQMSGTSFAQGLRMC